MTSTLDLSAIVASVEPDSMGERLGLVPGDVVISVNGVVPRDVIEWYSLVDEPEVSISFVRNGEEHVTRGTKRPGESFGVGVSSAVFDRVHTCDNHCEFCFIYQLPKGLRRSLYLKDDDYRLSFLFGNFTTLTRFTEADLERVIEERLSPIFVSLHAITPAKRAEMLRNERGGCSLRWLSELLRNGIEVRGQIVLCPGVNDGDILEETLLGILEDFPGLHSVAVVPLGLSRFNTESRMRVHTSDEAKMAVETIERWREVFTRIIGRPMVYAADELYLTAHGAVPESAEYGDFPMLEDGIGLARLFLEEFRDGRRDDVAADDSGFFASADRVHAANPTSYIAENPAGETGLRPSHTRVVSLRRRGRFERVVILTGQCAYPVVKSAASTLGHEWLSVEQVGNEFFGGNTAVAGLLVGEDLDRAMSTHAVGNPGCLYLIPDVCLNNGRFLDGMELTALQARHHVEVVGSRGHTLRTVLDQIAKEVGRDK